MGMLLLSASLALASKVAYWRYVMLITPGVVLLESQPGETLLVDLERLGFTLAGAALALVTAVAVRAIATRLESRRSHTV